MKVEIPQIPPTRFIVTSMVGTTGHTKPSTEQIRWLRTNVTFRGLGADLSPKTGLFALGEWHLGVWDVWIVRFNVEVFFTGSFLKGAARPTRMACAFRCF